MFDFEKSKKEKTDELSNLAPREFWASKGKVRLIVSNQKTGSIQDLGEFNTAQEARASWKNRKVEASDEEMLIDDVYVLSDPGEHITAEARRDTSQAFDDEIMIVDEIGYIVKE